MPLNDYTTRGYKKYLNTSFARCIFEVKKLTGTTVCATRYSILLEVRNDVTIVNWLCVQKAFSIKGLIQNRLWPEQTVYL